jgi:hypothetical protein
MNDRSKDGLTSVERLKTPPLKTFINSGRK